MYSSMYVLLLLKEKMNEKNAIIITFGNFINLNTPFVLLFKKMMYVSQINVMSLSHFKTLF